MVRTEAARKANGTAAAQQGEATATTDAVQPADVAAGAGAQDKPSLHERRQNAEEIRRVFENGEYPYKRKISRKDYEKEKAKLQVELLKAQRWIEDTGQKVVMLFEGRDAAGKGGTIKRFMEHLNPRMVRACRGAGQAHRPRNARSGTSSAISSICLRQAKWFCSTGPGTTAPVSSGSWASARPTSTSSSCARHRNREDDGALRHSCCSSTGSRSRRTSSFAASTAARRIL
jgi:hypothetical protein